MSKCRPDPLDALVKILAEVVVEEFCSEIEKRPHLESSRDDQARPNERTE